MDPEEDILTAAVGFGELAEAGASPPKLTRGVRFVGVVGPPSCGIMLSAD